MALVAGCSTGIGFATAAAMARAGHEAFAGERNPAAAPELAHLCASEASHKCREPWIAWGGLESDEEWTAANRKLGRDVQLA